VIIDKYKQWEPGSQKLLSKTATIYAIYEHCVLILRNVNDI